MTEVDKEILREQAIKELIKKALEPIEHRLERLEGRVINVEMGRSGRNL